MALELRHKYNILNKLYQEISEKGIQNLTIKDIADVRQGWGSGESVLINFVNEIAKEYPPNIQNKINKILKKNEIEKGLGDEYTEIIKNMKRELEAFKNHNGGHVPFGVNHAKDSYFFPPHEKRTSIKNILNLLIKFMEKYEKDNQAPQANNPNTPPNDDFEYQGDPPPTGGKRKKSKAVTLKTPYLRGKTKKPRKYRRKTNKK